MEERDAEALEALGWGPDLAEAFAPYDARGLTAGRVVARFQGLLRVHAAAGEQLATLAGRLRHEARDAGELPVTGDWVAVSLPRAGGNGQIQARLPRRTCFVRRAPGSRDELQALAANLDTVLLVGGLDGDYNPRRIERGLVLARDSGARPAVILNKADLCADPEGRRREIEALAAGAPVHVASAATGQGLAELRSYLATGRTVALLGSSGVGKSTLINRLLGREAQRTTEVRASDARGRHTTTHRELFLVPGGGLVMDTPGMRELQLWAEDEGLADTFEDVETVAARCRFSDCGHESEPGCAVQGAVAERRLDPARLASYHKLSRELQHLATRLDPGAQRAARRGLKPIHKALRNFNPRGRA